MYEASGTLYSSSGAPGTPFTNQSPAQYSTTTGAAVIYQPAPTTILQPYIQPIQPAPQYFVQQQMWSASFQQAPAANYYPHYAIQQPAFTTATVPTPDQSQTAVAVPLANLARLVHSSSQGYTGSVTPTATTGGGGQSQIMSVNSASTSTSPPKGSPSPRTKMVPAILKSMGGGARTKAKMREMLEYQKKMEQAQLAKEAKQQAQAAKKKRIRKPKLKLRDVRPSVDAAPVSEERPAAEAGPSSGTPALDLSLEEVIKRVVSADSAGFYAAHPEARPQSTPGTPSAGSSGIVQTPGSIGSTPTSELKKKGPRGRPRKYPRPEDVVAAVATPSPAKSAQKKPFTVVSPGRKGTPAKVKEERLSSSVEPEPGTSTLVKRKKGRPRKSELSILPAPMEIQAASPPKATSPKRLSAQKSPSPAKTPSSQSQTPAARTVSPKERKPRLSPTAAAALKVKASEKLKTAKVRSRAKALKEEKEKEGIDKVRANMAAAASKLNQRRLKTTTLRVKVRRRTQTPEPEEVEAPTPSVPLSPPPSPSKVAKQKLVKPTEESMDETIDYVIGAQAGDKKKHQPLPPGPAPAVASTSAAAVARMAQASPMIITAKAGSKKVPTVLVNRSDLKVLKRLSGKERKEHRQKGPSLKVKKEKVTFYRGGEEEDEPVVRVGQERPRFDFDEAVHFRCVFCNFKQFSFGLGDLFGPYYVNRLVNGQCHARETWIHSGCSVWAPGVVLIGSTLLGLNDAVLQSERVGCTICKKPGATIACFERRCREVVHLPCAMLNRWSLNERNFRSTCHTHAAAVAVAGAAQLPVAGPSSTLAVSVSGVAKLELEQSD